jgi:hypothetical protein
MEEAETLAELFAVRLHRFPHVRILGVVVDHQHFVVLVIERGQRIERDDHHLRRLVVAGQVDRHERLLLRRIWRQHAGMAHPARRHSTSVNSKPLISRMARIAICAGNNSTSMVQSIQLR